MPYLIENCANQFHYQKKENILFLIYSNFGTKKTKYERTNNIKIKSAVKNIKLIPEVKIKTDQLKKTKKCLSYVRLNYK